MSSGRSESTPAASYAAAGARARSDTAFWGTGGGVGRCSGFPGTRLGRQRARTRRAGPLAAATSWPAATSSRARWEMGLGGENGGGEHRRNSGGSQWIHSRRGRGRGGSGAGESGVGDRRVRRGGKRRGGASGAPGGRGIGEVGRVRSGGACGLVGEAREARWPWWQWTAATSALGRERGRAEKGEGVGRE